MRNKVTKKMYERERFWFSCFCDQNGQALCKKVLFNKSSLIIVIFSPHFSKNKIDRCPFRFFNFSWYLCFFKWFRGVLKEVDGSWRSLWYCVSFFHVKMTLKLSLWGPRSLTTIFCSSHVIIKCYSKQ